MVAQKATGATIVVGPVGVRGRALGPVRAVRIVRMMERIQMARLCEARITKIPIRGKAHSLKPSANTIPANYLDGAEVCGGLITFSVGVSGGCHTDHGADYCYCGPEEINVSATCTRCRNPHYDGIERLIYDDARYEIERILNDR